MSRFSVHRPSPAIAVALAALTVALGGTALAAGRLVNGDSLIKKGSLSGNRLRHATITGSQINLHRLGQVPTAAHAATAGSALTAGALGQVTYRTATFAVPPSLGRVTGTATCDHGSLAVGGGMTSPNETTSATDFLVDSAPTSSHTGWEATVENDSSSTVTETVWAVCVPVSAP